MELYTVVITSYGGEITHRDSGVTVDRFDSYALPGSAFELAELNLMLRGRGWSVTSAWQVMIRDSRTIELENVVLRRASAPDVVVAPTVAP